MSLKNEEDIVLIKSAAAVIIKVSFFICATVIFCTSYSSCDINEDIIERCEDACQATGAKMESVTSTKCTCSTSSSLSNQWVIPTK